VKGPIKSMPQGFELSCDVQFTRVVVSDSMSMIIYAPIMIQ